jgi:cytochrome P450
MAAFLKSRLKDAAQPARQEVMNDLLFLLQAGTQTASQLIVWGLMYLEQDQDWRKELLLELAQWSPANFSSLHQWPKLMATVLELERLRPSIPYFIMYPKTDFVYQGVLISKNSQVLHPLTLPHFMAEIYDEPLCFKPQRFLGERRMPQRPAHGTFGGGRHACPGQTLARTKVALALAAILTKYAVRFEAPLSFHPSLAATITPNKEVPARFIPLQFGNK